MPPFVIKLLAGAAGAVLLVFVSVQWGKSMAYQKVAEEQAKLERDWGKKMTKASTDAYNRGLTDAKKDVDNERTVEDIAGAAGSEDGADDLCLSADIVERLRELR